MSDKRRGLGRGFAALLGESPAAEVRHADALPLIPVEFLKPGPFQPRRAIKPDTLQELADSLKAQGMVQPIVVRRVGTDDYQIIAGERRWRAAQIAGIHEVPVLIRDLSDQAAMAIGLIENIQREDLNPLETAEALQRLINEFGMTHQKVAEAVGKSRVAVTNLLRLNDLAPAVKQLLLGGQIDMGHARALLSLPVAAQLAVAERVASENLTVRATEAIVRKALTPRVINARTKVDNDTARLEDSLSRGLGTEVRIQSSAEGRGRLVIAFKDVDQLQDILGRTGLSVFQRD